MDQRDIEQRIQNRLQTVYYKPWYKRKTGRIILILAVIVMAFLTWFLFQVVQNVRQIQNFSLDKTIEQLRSDPNFTKLVSGDDPIKGSAEPDVIVVAFEDFECPFCLEAQPSIERMLQKYGDKVMFIYRDFPLSNIHPNAQEAAEAANCADEQDAFWEYHDQLFARQAELSPVTYRKIAESLGLDLAQFNICLNTHKYRDEVLADYKAGQELGVVGTPTFFINGQIFPGVLPDNYWDGIIPVLISNE